MMNFFKTVRFTVTVYRKGLAKPLKIRINETNTRVGVSMKKYRADVWSEYNDLFKAATENEGSRIAFKDSRGRKIHVSIDDISYITSSMKEPK